jgi:hypothetical protein
VSDNFLQRSRAAGVRVADGRGSSWAGAVVATGPPSELEERVRGAMVGSGERLPSRSNVGLVRSDVLGASAGRPDALGASALRRRPRVRRLRPSGGRCEGEAVRSGRMGVRPRPYVEDRRLDRSTGRTSVPWRTASARPRPRSPAFDGVAAQVRVSHQYLSKVEGAAGRGGCEGGMVDRACVPPSVPVPFDPSSSSMRTSTLASADLCIGRAVKTRAPVVGLRDPHGPAVTPGLGRDLTVPRAPGLSGRRGVAWRVHRRGGDRGLARATQGSPGAAGAWWTWRYAIGCSREDCGPRTDGRSGQGRPADQCSRAATPAAPILEPPSTARARLPAPRTCPSKTRPARAGSPVAQGLTRPNGSSQLVLTVTSEGVPTTADQSLGPTPVGVHP